VGGWTAPCDIADDLAPALAKVAITVSIDSLA